MHSNHHWQAESLDELKAVSGVCPSYMVYISDRSHSSKTGILSWGGSSYGLNNALPVTVKNHKSSPRCVFACVRLTTLSSLLFPSIVIKQAHTLRNGHEELIHAGTWNVSSLRFDSLWGNKDREGEETHESGISWPGECCLSARGSSCLDSGSRAPLGFP